MKILRDQMFWLGAMSAFAIVFFALFVGIVKGKVSFDGQTAPRVAAPAAGAGNYGAGEAPAKLSARDAVLAAAKTAKLNTKKFETCIDDGKFKDMIQGEITKANAAGAQGTPYSVAIKGDKMVVINGAQPKTSILATLDGFDTAVGETDITVEPITEADHFVGPADAPITIVEYSDIDCPFCKRFHATMQELVQERTDVKWVYRHLPLAQLHPDAPFKAEASECAADLGGNEKFWTFLDTLIVS